MRGRPGQPDRAEEGLALPLTLFALAVLALLAAALAGVTAAGVEGTRLADWDREALYAAEAGIEHQLFLLKGDPGAPPVSGPQWLLPGRTRYRVVALSQLAAAGTCPPGELSRTWEITTQGELLQGSTVLHARGVRALVEVCYDALLVPRRVLIHGWQEF